MKVKTWSEFSILLEGISVRVQTDLHKVNILEKGIALIKKQKEKVCWNVVFKTVYRNEKVYNINFFFKMLKWKFFCRITNPNNIYLYLSQILLLQNISRLYLNKTSNSITFRTRTTQLVNVIHVFENFNIWLKGTFL